MKKIIIIANWKSNKNEKEVKEWLEKFSTLGKEYPNKEIIVCPSFPHLTVVNSYISNNFSPIKLGAQDISFFGPGSNTGEVNGDQIRDFASFVIIGHSERRKNGENEEIIEKKLKSALESSLIPIICISAINQLQKLKSIIQDYNSQSNIKGKILVAYEPLFAIGSGNPDTPENAEIIAKEIKKELGDVFVLYGGSVNSQNVNGYVKMSEVDGVLVGKASLDPLEFAQIIKNA